MMTRVAIKVRRGVKSCEREASKREPKGAMPPDELLSRDMVVYFDTGEVCQLLFKALVLVVSSRLVSEGEENPRNCDSTSENNFASMIAQHTHNMNEQLNNSHFNPRGLVGVRSMIRVAPSAAGSIHPIIANRKNDK
jgi:hypothetical protein